MIKMEDNQMAKQQWKPSTLLNPVPVVMVTCQGKEGIPNIITLAWVGTINSDPPMVSISVRKERHSYKLLKENGEFVINLSSKKLTFATDLCGVKSGKDTDKFKAAKLTPEKATKVSVPLIKESPVNLECKVKKSIELGSHVMFLAEIVAVNVDESIINEKGKLSLEKADPICYSHGEYWSVEKPLGYFGFSVNKKKTVRSNRNMPLKDMKNAVARAATTKSSKDSTKAPIKPPINTTTKAPIKLSTKEPIRAPIKTPTKTQAKSPRKTYKK
jgi:flavin reductase (DIM6/NTAB) family NADH-FMN oxidoreductase RutF